MEITNHIKYDIAKRGIPPVVDAVQGEENSRSIELSVFANGSAFSVDGCVCSLAFKKPDGTSGWYDTMPDGSSAYSVTENVVSIKIAPQVLTVAGEVCSAIRIESTDGSDRATTFPIIINVSADPAIDAIKSENYYSVQNWSDVNSAIDELRKLIESGGIEPLIVTIDDTGSRVTHTAAQIHEHAVSGGDVWLEDGGERIALTKHTPDVAQFSTIGVDHSALVYTVFSDGTFDYVYDVIGGGSTEGAVLYTPQALTEEQKTQARDNIGAANEAELADIRVTPQMFGAVGDGVTDDTDALQQAVNSGKPVTLPTGKYRITATIDMPEYASITGTAQSTILPECETLFNLSGTQKYEDLGYGKNFFSGFEIRITSENVITVFDFNDAITKQGMLTTIENLRIDNNSQVIPDMYTVFHFHSNNGGMAYAIVRDCFIRNNATTGGYVARVYNDAEGDGWVSSVHFSNNFSSAFKWHYFFASDDVNMINTHGGFNKVTNCTAQCTKDTLGFVFWKNSGAVELTANHPWDWSAASSSGSKRNPGCPYVVGSDYAYNANYEAIISNEGLAVDNISVYDGETFVRNEYSRVDKMLQIGGRYPSKLIPKFTSVARAKCVRLIKRNSSFTSYTRVRFILFNEDGINYVTVVPYFKKVYSSKPLGSICFSVSADEKEIYMHHINKKDSVGVSVGLMSYPVTNSDTGFSVKEYSQTLGHEFTIDCIEKLDECMFDVVPEGANECTWIPEPTYIAGTDGKMYKVELSFDNEGKPTINATYAYRADNQLQ